MTTPNPYSLYDLQRPSDEGRSLHDDANLFYRQVMHLQTRIVQLKGKVIDTRQSPKTI